MPFNLEQISGLLLAGVALVSAVFTALWLASIIWTFRDMRARSRDVFAQVMASLMVAVLSIPGLLVYLILRPQETLAEQYERSLEEEALLQELEDKPVCPGCGHRVKEVWRVCPYCHTKLRKPCHNCSQLLELSWSLCPYCGESQYGDTPRANAAAARTAATPPVTDAEYGLSYEPDDG